MPSSPHPFVIPDEAVHLTPSERAARGKAARAEVPRTGHAEFAPASTRPDPIALLESQAASRVPELVPIRYGRMLVSPFTFYRGAALVMASDLAGTPRSGLAAQSCGDAHLSNFGAFGTPERNLVFDINDFDETNPGPWEWDVKRLTASLEVAGRDRGFTPEERRSIVMRGVSTYRETMATFAGQANLDVWYAALSADAFLAQAQAQATASVARRAAKSVAKARTRDSMQAFDKLTTLVDGRRRIISDPPLIVPIETVEAQFGVPDDVEKSIRGILLNYRRTLAVDRRHLLEEFDYVHAARKVVGVGSVGTRAWIVLMQGRDDGDPLFLQAKEAQPSVLEAFVGRSRYRTHGERVVAGQRLMQSASDIFLGWDTLTGFDGLKRSFYIRQLRDWKGSADIDVMTPESLAYYAGMCGWTLAKAHARSGDRIAIAAYLGTGDVFDRAIADFAAAYADQNEKDYQALREAVDSGRVVAQSGL